MRFSSVFLPSLLIAASLGCHAQVPPAAASSAKSSNMLTPEQARRVEVLLRSRLKVPPDYSMVLSPRGPSDIPGFDTIDVVFVQNGETSKPLEFLLSKDTKTLAQFNKYDISADPKNLVSGKDRPARGGPDSAPVTIVSFDDLECPFCARMHAQLFPALVNRYGDSVHIVYRDFPITQHPWAMRAAIDSNCDGSQNPKAYWNLVDYIHAHASDFGGEEKSLAKANDMLDKLTLDEAKKDSLNTSEVEACIKKQDETAMKASLKLGESLDVNSTPTMFINGERLEGAYPLEDVFRMVDAALVAAGRNVPAPYVPPAPPTPAQPAAKSGS